MSKLLKSWLSNNRFSKGVFKILFITVFFLSQIATSAQIIAGDTALGQVISDPLVDLFVATVHETRYSLIDLDCDSIVDIRIELKKGSSMVDIPNVAYLKVLNPLIEICADTNDAYAKTVNYYNEADTLICLDSNDWQNDTIYKLGDYGSMTAEGPWSIDTSYIYYRNTATGQQGWVKIFFDLIDQGNVTNTTIELTVTEVLSPCVNTAMPDPIYNVTITDTTSISCGIFSFDAIVTPVSCNGNCDGSIEILNLTGGNAPYTFLWPSIVSINQSVSNLCSGYMSVTITDTNEMACVHNFYVPVATPIEVLLQSNSVSCNGGSDGSIFATVTGGTWPYSYSWDNGDLDSIAENLYADIYTLCVTDSNGCTVCVSDTITEPTLLVSTINTSVNVSCNGGNDGEATVTTFGGTSPYSYLWSNGGAGATQTGLIAGTYTVYTTDTLGCTDLDTLVITEPDPIQVLLQSNSVSCNGGSDGSICATVTGGTWPYTYNWVTSDSDSIAENLIAGGYTVCVTDSNGCLVCVSDTVTEPPILVITDTVINASCAGCSDGEIQLTVYGGTPVYSYLWNPIGNGTNLTIGTYSYCVTDSHGCTTCDSATVSFATSIQTTINESDFSIYPNPTKERLNITHNHKGKNYVLKIVDLLGTIVYSENLNTNQNIVPVSQLANGIYLVVLSNTETNEQTVKKLVIQQ